MWTTLLKRLKTPQNLTLENDMKEGKKLHLLETLSLLIISYIYDYTTIIINVSLYKHYCINLPLINH